MKIIQTIDWGGGGLLSYDFPTAAHSPAMAVLAADELVPFAHRVFPWADNKGRKPRVRLGDRRYFLLKFGPHHATALGLYDAFGDQITVRTPWDQGSVFDRSVLLHETVHWLQRHTFGLQEFTSDNIPFLESMAFKTQMAYLTANGYDVRKNILFSPENLIFQTAGNELILDNYAWLDAWRPSEDQATLKGA